MKIDYNACNIQMPDSYLSRIGSFMQWAHDKISNEIEINEKIETEFGTAEHQSAKKARTHTQLNLREKSLAVKKIDRLRSEGDKVYTACQKVGIHIQTYYKWRKL